MTVHISDSTHFWLVYDSTHFWQYTFLTRIWQYTFLTVHISDSTHFWLVYDSTHFWLVYDSTHFGSYMTVHISPFHFISFSTFLSAFPILTPAPYFYFMQCTHRLGTMGKIGLWQPSHFVLFLDKDTITITISFHQYLRYFLNNITIVFSISDTILWAQSHIASTISHRISSFEHAIYDAIK